jgi:hypothetical protein
MFITNTNKFNYQLLQLHTLIMHFDPFRKYFHIAPGIESVENRTCSVGNSVIIFLHFKKIAFKVFIGH